MMITIEGNNGSLEIGYGGSVYYKGNDGANWFETDIA